VEDIKAYIETGILELFVLGQLTAQEEKEVQEMAVHHPEVKEEINAIEIAMEQYALYHAINPSEGLEHRIFTKINFAESSDPIITTPPAPASQSTAKIVPLDPKPYDSKIRTLRFSLVACIALLVVSVVALLSAHSKLDSAQSEIAALTSQNSKFAATVGFMENTNKDLQKIADIAGDKSWAIVNLAGTPKLPKAQLRVFWNKNTKDVLLDKKKMALPANDASHQYQLWALVNGKPVDLGVFDSNDGASAILQSMKASPVAQAFAVTLEKHGGSASPTMDQLVLMGNITI
jgi:anti-sigma-K factor RskA